MEQSFINIKQHNLDRLKKADKFNQEKYIDNSLKQEKIKMSLLNVDSTHRNIEPKNIVDSKNIFLPNNPIKTTVGSSRLKFNYPNHNFKEGDNIIIENVEGINKNLSNILYLINNLDYLLVYFNHGIPENYLDYVDEIKIDLSLISPLNSNTNLNTRFYDNIPINMLLGPKVITTYHEISNLVDLYQDQLTKKFNITKEDFSKKFLFIKLDFKYSTNSNQTIFTIPHVYNIKFLNIAGIPLTNINANFPINQDRFQSNYQIISTLENYFEIDVKIKANVSDNFGGNKINVFKILKTLSGYPNASEFTIPLKNNFTNVVRVELITTEIPFTTFVVQNNINSKLYWQHLDDGDKIYSINLPSGNYSASNLINKISDLMNQVERLDSTDENRKLNRFEILLNVYTQEITFKGYSEILLPNSLSESIVTIQNKEYYKITVKHPNNFVKVGDIITISGSDAIGDIPKKSINTIHKIIEVNKSEETYAFLLEPFNTITSTSEQRGGASVKIKTPAKFRFLFYFQDTLGEILNFPDTGKKHAITPYSDIITNFTSYIYPTPFNSVGSVKDKLNIFQLSGKNTYWLLYINDFKSVQLSNGLPSAFAKLLLAGEIGDYMFNAFTNSPIEFDKPIPTLSELHVKLTDPNGNLVNLYNTNFSFTLQIYEKISNPKDTMKISKNSSFVQKLTN